MLHADELIIDGFAGGGGASEGIYKATGRHPDYAVNHDAGALLMHAANHPTTTHMVEDIFAADIVGVVGRRRVGLLWISPDCRHFSRAKGTAPVSQSVRSLAWFAVKCAATVRPRIIILENVREFESWGPIVPRLKCKDSACGWAGTLGQAKTCRAWAMCPRCNSKRKLLETGELLPDPAKKGLTFKQFCGRLRGLGYVVEWRTLDAADYGAPTHRKRLFLVARRDGLPIVFPDPTHCHPSKARKRDLFGPGLEPWRTAAECIDWSIPCPSIFDRKRPLKPKTEKRIAHGLKRYVIDAARPFIVPLTHGGDRAPHSIDEPARTITGANRGECAVIVPTLIQTGYGEREGQAPRVPGLEKPLGTVVSGGVKAALVTPFISRFNGAKGENDQRGQSVELPTSTLDTSNRLAVVAPILAGMGGSDYAGKPVPVDQPFGTVKTEDRRGVAAAFLAKHFGGVVGCPVETPLPTILSKATQTQIVTAHVQRDFSNSVGHSADEPLGTVTAGGGGKSSIVAANLVHLNHGDKTVSGLDEPARTVTAGGTHQAVVAAALVRNSFGEKQANGADEPAPTITTQANKLGLVYAFLTKYFGTGIAKPIDEPAGTVTSKDRFGLVTVEIDGEPWVVVDVGMRMLTPTELKRAQGFPESYILVGNKTEQVHRIGNSVSPPVAEAVVRANCGAPIAVHV